MPRKIEISYKTILFTLFAIGAALFLYYIRDILLLLFVALLIMVILNPTVSGLARFKIPRAASVLIVYLSFFVVLIISLSTIIPLVVEQTTNFVGSLPSYIADLQINPWIKDQVLGQLLTAIGGAPAKILDFSVGIISNIFTLLTVLTFAFYLLMARNKLDKQLTE